jgi:hypothetical protein
MRNVGILSAILAPLALVSSAGTGAAFSATPQVGGDLCTGGNTFGTGLRGAYYTADPKISKPVLVRVDARVSSAAVRSLPRATTAPNLVRWCGWIRPVASGPHRLQLAGQAARIELAKQSVLPGASVQLEAGKAYAILIELKDPAKAGDFSLQWTPPFGATYDVPPTVLFPPVETVQPGC